MLDFAEGFHPSSGRRDGERPGLDLCLGRLASHMDFARLTHLLTRMPGCVESIRLPL